LVNNIEEINIKLIKTNFSQYIIGVIMADDDFLELSQSLEKIREVLQGDGYFSIDDVDSISESRTYYSRASKLIISTWEMVKKKGFKIFFSQSYEEHTMIGEIVTILESYYYLIEDYDNLYKTLVNEIPSVDSVTFFIFFDTHIYIYLSEISRYAKEKNEQKAKTLYNTLLKLKNNQNIIIPKDFSTLEQLSNLSSSYF
jgi:hypothetical protein